MKISLPLICALFISILAHAIGHETNGGNLVSEEFISRGYFIYNTLLSQKENPAILDEQGLARFKDALVNTRVQVLDQDLMDSLGDSVDARTGDDPENPGHKLIQLKQSSWIKTFADGVEVYKLVFHEYLWAMGMNDTNFRISVAFQIGNSPANGVQDPFSQTGPQNLDFESNPVAGVFPAGWGGSDASAGYAIVNDPTTAHSGIWSARISSMAGHQNFGTITQCFKADNYLNKQLAYTGYLQTSAVSNGYAGLWMRVDDSNGKILAFDNMQNRGLTGNTNWSQSQITLQVPSTSARICFGVLLVGDGTVWLDTLNLTTN